ncbi:hypothetical protein LRM44_00430 [Candidatus Nanosynbacter sp. HMT-352]|uniref:hypothetical protein n=1 Tax=Candidatus Nanosynbacter sp. HMT-352 TaxID=2899133 RepID=UPI001FB64031|nr:hypothetical protein [Candidatus Nanosynbacter sp. HMT-352]UOG66530.1 hypothetical protein LRM44_00430 [Candidatus Nanosynbacter sp. HMT-352]
MIGVTTTVELSSTVIDGDDFDVFLSLRDGNISEDFSSSVGEEVTDGVGRFDLVAVASGEAELPSTEKVSVSIGQTACATCVGCPFLSQCVKPQALVMKQESERQENVSDDMNSADEEAIPNLLEMTPKQSYLDRLLAPDDFDSLDENGRGELVLAGYSESTDYQEPIIKKAPEPVVSEAKPIDLTTKTNKSTEKLIPQEREDKTSTNQAVEASGEDVGIEKIGVVSPSVEMKPHIIDSISDAVHNDSKKPAPESLDAPTKTENAPVSVVIDKNTQTVDDNSNSLEHETVYPATSDNKIAAKVVESEPSRAAENDESAFTSISEQQHLAAQFDAVGADKSAITGPIDNSGTKAPIYIQSNEINIDATPDYNNSVESTDIVDNERLVDTAIVDEAKVDPPNEEIDILAADQIFTDTQVLSIEQLDYSGTAIERSHGKDNDFWAEEDAVFFIERQESPVVESEASSAEAVTIALPVETITVRGETDDSEPVEQVIISTSPIIEPTLDVESDEVATKIPEECLVLREEFVKISEKSDLLRSDDEIESVIMDVSDIKSGINLSGEKAELNDILDDCVYNGEESVANGDDLLMNAHPSSGLWSDDSTLNPEEGLVTMTQSAADDSSLVSRLVGVLVVAMCVARGRQARAIPNS